jgi:RNA polymerase sigma-70 factor (ECF subfamily)
MGGALALSSSDTAQAHPGDAPLPPVEDETAGASVDARKPRGWTAPLAALGGSVSGRNRQPSPDASESFEVEGPRDAADHDRVVTDQTLMAAIAGGDAKSFARLVADVTPVVLRFARSVLDAAGDEAEEVVQEALIRLWQNADSWQPTGRILTWLHRVAFRLCIDSLRRRRPSLPIDDVADVLPDEGPLPGARLQRLDDVRAIRAAIAALPARQRAAIALCYFQGLNQADGAAVMGVGEHAYESLLARARRNLRATLSTGRTTP